MKIEDLFSDGNLDKDFLIDAAVVLCFKKFLAQNCVN